MYRKHFKFSFRGFLGVPEDLKLRTLDPHGFNFCFYIGDYELAYFSPRT